MIEETEEERVNELARRFQASFTTWQTGLKTIDYTLTRLPADQVGEYWQVLAHKVLADFMRS
jgi:hypothetical protein